METWYAFRAYNEPTRYGFGTADQAERYAEQLNASRTINYFAPFMLSDGAIADLKLKNGDLGFNLVDELS